MNLYPRESHLWDGAAEGYEFGWGASPGVDVKEEPSKHSSTTLSPALIAIVAVLGSAFLIVSYYKIFAKYCKSCRWSNIIRRLRRVDSREQLDDSDVVLQDPDGWQIFTHAYGLDEVVIKSIPVCTYSRGEKFIDGTECAVCLVEFQENESLRVLPKCSHAFHITCIDLWLRSHANCPLCRANIVNSDSLFVPAMAARIRPSLEHGMALVMHDSFRSEEFNGNARHADQVNNTSQAEPVTLGSVLQSRSIVDERTVDVDPFLTKKSPDEALGAAVADVTERNDMENGLLLSSPSNLARSYSFGSCSGNEIFRSESTREAERIDLESPMDSLLVTDIASPWRYRRTTFRWSKRFSPFNSKSLFPFNPRGLRSPFFRKGSSSSATYFPSIFPRSPTRRSMADSRHGGATSVRGGSLSPPFFRMARSESVSSLRNQAMTSPLFIKKSFSVFPPSRLRTGDPEALLSPPRFNQHHR